MDALRYNVIMTANIDVSLSSAAYSSVDEICDQTSTAEDLGYHRVWVPETWGRNTAVTLSTLVERTDRVGLGTSILPVYSRSPALAGQTAATLQEHSGGRFRLGLGASGPAVVEKWHGVEFERPLRRIREYIDIVRMVVSGEVVNYDGDLFSLSDFRLRFDPPDDPPPIDVAGLGPKSVELAGRFADGWHGLMLTPDGIRDRRANIELGAELGTTDLEEHEVLIKVPSCVLEDGDRARDLVRRHFAFYIGAMGTFYRDALLRQGYDVADTVHDRWQQGDRAAATEAIGDDLLENLAIAGTPEQARDALRRFVQIDGISTVAITFPREATHKEMKSTLTTLAPYQ
jgi:coenzyme F420-dependent oxidoreductase